jgi:CHAT domain-containing protein/tetratricopeptide (TPR) repeat protein
LTRPFDKHLDSDELDGLVSSHAASVTDSGRLAEQALEDAQRHVESCQDCSRKVQMHKSVQSEILRMGVPSNAPPSPDCVADTEWPNVAAGLLPEAKTRELMKHAAQCGHCGPLLKNAAETLADEATPGEETALASLSSRRPAWQRNMASTLRSNVQERKQRRSWWRALFAWPTPAYAFVGVAAVAVVAWIGVRTLRPLSAEQLLAQAYTEHRTLEPRIARAKYAPMRVERGAGASNLDKSPALLKAEALIGENLRQHPNDPAWLQARARADLLDGNYDSAIKSLQRALETEPDSPSLLTDLGSAYFLRAESADRPLDYGDAIESLGKALSKSPDDPIALFNRALACERLYLYTQAVDDWEHYLRIDPQGDWSNDARARLTALQEKIKQHDKSQAEPLLTPGEIAEAGVNDAAVRAKVDERIEGYLNIAVTDWLPDAYPTGTRQGAYNRSELRSALAILSTVANDKHADRWLADMLESASSPGFAPAVAELSAALKANDTGDNVAARKHAVDAEKLFASVQNDAGNLRARVEYLFASHDAQEANPCLQAADGLEARLINHPYPWLISQFHIEEGTCYRLRGNIGETRRLYQQAAANAQVAGYGTIYLRTQDHLSSLDGTTGILPEGWSRTQRALDRFWSGHYPPMRGYNLYYNLYEFSRLSKQPHLQMAEWRDGLALSESFSDNVIRAMAHSLMADAAIGAEQPNIAKKEFTSADQLFAAAPQIRSIRIARLEAEARLGEVETGEGNAQRAKLRLRQLEPEISQLSDNLLAIQFYTALSDAESKVGDGSSAQSSLSSAIGFAEVELQSLEDDVSRQNWSQQTSKTYRNFVQLRLRQGDAQEALEIWEWYRGAAQRATGSVHPVGVTRTFETHEVANRLPDLARETLVSYALLPHGMATWVYDNRGIFVHWTEGTPTGIEASVRRFRILCSDPTSDDSDRRQNARFLYDQLTAPIEKYLASDRILFVELDEGLEGMPYEALIDTQNRYLADRWPVLSSAGVYYRPRPHAHDSIESDASALIVAVPTSEGAEGLPVKPLPDAVAEGEMVKEVFSSARFIAGDQATIAAILSQLPSASIFHFAGHAISSPGQTGLLLSDGLLNAASLKPKSLAGMQLAVFSACDTLGSSAGGVYDADSLVRAFLRSGVPHVVASRWNVDSAATRQFMNLFYRGLLDGDSVANSINQAQIRLRSRPGMAHPYFWSAFTAFGAV